MDLPFCINHKLVRGLDYYTGTVFEFNSDNLGAQDALLGGGRYNRLVETLGGKPTPGIGFAAGIERFLIAMEQSNFDAKRSNPDVYLVCADNKALYVTYRQKLRDIPASTEFTTAVEKTKFPISPEFYNKIYLPKNVGVAYLSTDDQFKPLGEHYLRAFRDKISHYLVLKSFTEKGMFDLLLKEYGDFTRPDPILLDPNLKAQHQAWLDDLIAQVDANENYKSS